MSSDKTKCPNHEWQQYDEISLLCKYCGEPMSMRPAPTSTKPTPEGQTFMTYMGKRISLCDNCPQFKRNGGWQISQCNACSALTPPEDGL